MSKVKPSKRYSELRKKRIKKPDMKSIDYILLCAILILLVIGTVMIYSASSYYGLYSTKSQSVEFFFLRHVIWLVIGIVAMFVTMSIDYHKYKKIMPFIIILSIALLVLVLFIGPNVNGARRWFQVGGVSVQPSELAKYVVVVHLAFLIERRKAQTRLKGFFAEVFIYLLFAGFFAALVLAEKNLSITAVIMMAAFIIIFVSGADISKMLWMGLAGIGIGALAIRYEPYRLQRVTAFMNPFKDPTGKSFQIVQSLYSIGSGGFFGLGFGNSRQKALFLPESHTDFIFSITAEELGIIGCTFIILLFIIIVLKAAIIARNAKDESGRLMAVGIASVISIQAIINIAVVTSSMPVTGVPMPLISYGGTSLVFNLLALGILLNISRQTKSTKFKEKK